MIRLKLLSLFYGKIGLKSESAKMMYSSENCNVINVHRNKGFRYHCINLKVK